MINQIMAASTKGAPTPEVGMGATVLMWSDRHAATIIATTNFKTGARAGQVKTVTIQYDKVKRIDKNGMGDNQTYTYEADPNGRTADFKVNKYGRFISLSGATLGIGYRDEHYDFSL
jgi:hypothetical protein